MATQLANITKDGGKYKITYPADRGDFKAGTFICKSVDEALAQQAAYNAITESTVLAGGRKPPTGLSYSIAGGKMTIVLDLNGSHGITKGTEKTNAKGEKYTSGGGNVLIGSTHGAIVVPHTRPDGKEVNVSINVYGK